MTAILTHIDHVRDWHGDENPTRVRATFKDGDGTYTHESGDADVIAGWYEQAAAHQRAFGAPTCRDETNSVTAKGECLQCGAAPGEACPRWR